MMQLMSLWLEAEEKNGFEKGMDLHEKVLNVDVFTVLSCLDKGITYAVIVNMIFKALRKTL